MRASELRHRVKHQSPTRVDDGQGGTNVTGWSDIKTIYAKIEPQSGQELIEHGKLAGERRYILVTRNRDINIDRDDRLVWGSKVLKVETPINSDSVKHWLTFDCFEQVN